MDPIPVSALAPLFAPSDGAGLALAGEVDGAVAAVAPHRGVVEAVARTHSAAWRRLADNLGDRERRGLNNAL